MCANQRGQGMLGSQKKQQQQTQMLGSIPSFSCEAALGLISLLLTCPLTSWTVLFLDSVRYDQHQVEWGYPIPLSGCCISINATYNYVDILGTLIIPLTRAEYKSPEI